MVISQSEKHVENHGMFETSGVPSLVLFVVSFFGPHQTIVHISSYYCGWASEIRITS